MKVTAFGEIVWDVYPENACLGGAPLNFAAHLARHGHEVAMLSAIGVDDYGDKALDVLHDWGVRTDRIARLPDYPTGACLVSLNEDGVPVYRLLENVAYDHIPPTSHTEADVLYFGTLALRSENNRNTLQHILHTTAFSDVFVDINIRAPFYTDDTIRFAIEHATILKISDEELPAVAAALRIDASDVTACLQQLVKAYTSVRCLILTCGSKGAVVYHREEDRLYTCSSKPVEVVSTVGAGDSFSAAFLHAYRGGKPIEQCVSYAAAVAAYVVSNRDAVPPYDPKSINCE